MQGHPELPQLWEKYADKILCAIGLKPTIHEPCLYSGLIDSQQVLFMHQVVNFAVAAPGERTANILFDMIDDRLTFPMKQMGLINLFNGLIIEQTHDYIKILCSSYIDKIMAKHLSNWLSTHDISNRPTTPPTKKSFLSSFLNDVGNPDPKIQQQLAKINTFGYRNGVGELIYALTTCRPDLGYATVRAAQYSGCPAAIHYQGLQHIPKYLYTKKDNGIIFWHVTPNDTLPKKSPPDLILTVAYMTSSLTAILSMIPWTFMLLLTRIGPPAPKHDVLLQAAASALQAVLLPIRLNSNPQLPNPPQRLNSWELVMPKKCYSMCVASCGTSGSLKQLLSCPWK
jgi:hypothetical protein